MKCENYMALEFPSRSSNEAFARSAVACFAAQLDPTLDELGDIKTAVSEAVTNCIVHAYRDTIGTVVLKCRILPDNTLDIVVKDRGCGIENVEEARKPMFTTGGEERSGMGFTIMESFMTELKVSSAPGKGTTVHMKRKLVRRGGKA
jgi:stage II sporulation protein AB (anti-sigma F factor)